MALHVGDAFASFSDFQSAVNNFESANNVSLYKRDCRSLEAAAKKGIKWPIKAEFEVYSMRLACYHGGKKFISRGTRKRPEQR